MRKVDRLFEILQFLRGRRLRTAGFLAKELGVSLRTVYRDIQGLMASGVPIEGEPGVGYVLRQPIELPPLKFTPLELKALQLGVKMVEASADEEMVHAVKEASIKILDALPQAALRKEAPTTHVYFEIAMKTRENLALLRDAISDKTKVFLRYSDAEEKRSKRTVRPLGLEYWGKVWTLTAWCELREDFRVFRVDRIHACRLTDKKFGDEKGKSYQDYLNRVKPQAD